MDLHRIINHADISYTNIVNTFQNSKVDENLNIYNNINIPTYLQDSLN